MFPKITETIVNQNHVEITLDNGVVLSITPNKSDFYMSIRNVKMPTYIYGTSYERCNNTLRWEYDKI